MTMMAREHWASYRWVLSAEAFLGVWQITSPAIFRCGSDAVSMIEARSGLMGDRRRRRTMPWMVVVFGLAVVAAPGARGRA